MPTDNDSIPIWKRMFGDWMKTHEFINLPPAMQAVANDIWQSLQEREMAHAVRAQQLQISAAQGLGMANAAAPQVKGVPSRVGDGQQPQPGRRVRRRRPASAAGMRARSVARTVRTLAPSRVVSRGPASSSR
jgi:hypothetical protein